VMGGNHDKWESNLENIIIQMIRNDEIQCYRMNVEVKDRMRIQGLIMLKCLRKQNIGQNVRVQEHILRFLIAKVQINQQIAFEDLQKVSLFFTNYKTNMMIFKEKVMEECSYTKRAVQLEET